SPPQGRSLRSARCVDGEKRGSLLGGSPISAIGGERQVRITEYDHVLEPMPCQNLTHLGTSAATARSAKAEIAESEYCSRFPYVSRAAGRPAGTLHAFCILPIPFPMVLVSSVSTKPRHQPSSETQPQPNAAFVNGALAVPGAVLQTFPTVTSRSRRVVWQSASCRQPAQAVEKSHGTLNGSYDPVETDTPHG